VIFLKTYLVTGGAGFIGANFINSVLTTRSNIKIINIDKLTYAGNFANMGAFFDNKNHVFIREDICNRKMVNQIFKSFNPDYVINFAAETHVDRSIKNSVAFIRTNITGTHILLEASRKYKIQRYLQISTDEVYGSLQAEGYFTEDSPLKPTNPYAASKTSADILVQAFFHTYQLPSIITRCTNNYGPIQNEEKLIPLIIKKCLRGEKIPIYGSGKNVRDWIYVADHCAALEAILENGREGEVYNIGANNEQTNIEVAKSIITILREMLPDYDERKKRINLELIDYVHDRPVHDWRYAINPVKTQKELKWAAQISFKEGLKRTIKWYLDEAPGIRL